ncbi:MAG: hypothetical protein N2Z22_11430 [Turneriella sp.]|nr:hypothetical protein [Turneriella sp.]
MIALIIPTRSEASVVLRSLQLVKTPLLHYRGMLSGRQVALFLVARSSIADIQKFLSLYRFDQVLFACAAFSLSPRFSPFAACTIQRIILPDGSYLPIGREGICCLAIPNFQKEALSLLDPSLQGGVEVAVRGFSAVVKSQIRGSYAFCVIAAMPGEEQFLWRQQLLDEFSAARPKTHLRWREIMRFGLWDYYRLQARQHRVAAAMHNTLKQLLAGKHGGFLAKPDWV